MDCTNYHRLFLIQSIEEQSYSINLSMTIAAFDHLDPEEKKALLSQCCASSAWVDKMLKMPPAEDLIDLFEDAEESWYACKEDDWKEAFLHHSKFNDIHALKEKFFSDQFEANEQSSIEGASEKTLQFLAEGNKRYEEKFGYIFIVCASGKSADEILEILNNRLQNDPEDEIKIAMDEQNKITKLRLENLFHS